MTVEIEFNFRFIFSGGKHFNITNCRNANCRTSDIFYYRGTKGFILITFHYRIIISGYANYASECISVVIVVLTIYFPHYQRLIYA